LHSSPAGAELLVDGPRGLRPHVAQGEGYFLLAKVLSFVTQKKNLTLPPLTKEGVGGFPCRKTLPFVIQ
jgi:hypothetical protein